MRDSLSVWETLSLYDANYMDAAQALYWYCADHHGGQNSREYAILSTLDYRPSAMERGPAEGVAADVYAELAAGRIDPEALRDWIVNELVDHAER